METIIVPVQSSLKKYTPINIVDENECADSNACGIIEKTLVLWAIKLQLFCLACITLRKPLVIWKTYKTMIRLRRNVWAGNISKLYRVDGKYYFNIYSPGWPSTPYNQICINELKRHTPESVYPEKTYFAFFAITRKCPMRCEHCFEWDNLNQKESFSKQELLKVMDLYHEQGVQQFHLSGGEPMTRLKDLLEVLKYSIGKSECWVATSGFNCTDKNANLLKEAGCTGVVISIDHYIPELHNIFRGHSNSFEHATNAVMAVKKAGMVASVSVCVTKAFIDGEHLLPYFEFAKKIGVHFVQFLEPRSIGHYEGKNVLLEESHIQILEDFFKEVNHSKKYNKYPTLLYHGYHQRRVGCFAGSRSIYIDSAGDVHSCPFCHTKSFNILELIRLGEETIPKKENVCPMYKKIA